MRLSRAVVPLSALMLSAQAHAGPWIFERVIESGPLEGANFVIDRVFVANLDGRNVGMLLVSPTDERRIVGWYDGAIQDIAGLDTPVPEGVGNFIYFQSTCSVDGDRIVFGGEDAGRTIEADGIYEFTPPGTLVKILDRDDPVPDSPGAGWRDLPEPDLVTSDGRILFKASRDMGVSDDGLFLCDDQGCEAVLFGEDPIPQGGDEFGFLTGRLALRGDTGAFVIDLLNAGPLSDSIWRFDANAIELIADDATTVPGGQVRELFEPLFFTALGVTDAGEVVFRGKGDAGTFGIYKSAGQGSISTIIDTTDFAPPDYEMIFTEFDNLAVDGDDFAFTASTSFILCGLYAQIDGVLSDVLDAGDVLDGKTVANVAIDNEALSDKSIAIRVVFEDQSRAVYLATYIGDVSESEPNNSAETANCITIDPNCAYISGKLQHNEYPECDPDTVLTVFNKQIEIIEDESGVPIINDDDPAAGDGRGSALWDLPLVLDTWAGTNTLRLGVTGAGDIVEGQGGSNGDFNGLLQNAPHGQMGEFTLTVTFLDDQGVALPSPAELPDGSFITNPIEYVEEFRTGGEAFYINYYCPIDAASAHAVVDNTTGRVHVCNDVDFITLKGLIPSCPYTVEQIGGVTKECEQTDGLLAWIDPDLGNAIKTDDNSGFGLYAAFLHGNELVADFDGMITIAFSGSGDENFNGLLDGQDEDDYLLAHPEYANDYPGVNPSPPPLLTQRAVDPVCADPVPAHGVCGCYTLKIALDAEGHAGPTPTVEDAMSHGDINMDGVTNTADLGLLVGSFGWTAP